MFGVGGARGGLAGAGCFGDGPVGSFGSLLGRWRWLVTCAEVVEMESVMGRREG